MAAPQAQKFAPLTLALLALLSGYQPCAQAQEAAPQAAAQAEEKPLPKVVVTGSRLARLQKEGVSPVTVLKAEDVDRLGYRNVAEALQSLTENVGFTQGEDFGNTFTPAANTISLRGLGPNHTLVLLNGRRLAEYPAPYNGSVNFVDLASLPSGLIDRIEVLSGGASAVYGSDAVAGVVNVVLKSSLKEVRASVRAGTTQRGGGTSTRVQLASPVSLGGVTGVAGLELSQREPIWSRQRPFLADTTLRGGDPSVVAGRRDRTNKYIGTPDCSDLAKGYEGSTALFTGKNGSYCGSGRAAPTHWTLQTEQRNAQALASLKGSLWGDHEWFADTVLGFTRTENNTRGPSWTSESAGKSRFVNANTGQLETWVRRITPEEYGGVDRFNRVWTDRQTSVTLGARGPLAGDWTYEVAAAHSGFTSQASTLRFLTNIDEFFLGKKQGADAKGFSIYKPDLARLTKALTPAEFDSITGESSSRNKSWSQQVVVTANGSLARLPAGDLTAAVVLEGATQGFTTQADPRLAQGVFYGTTDAPYVRGTRQRGAIGGELRVPFFKTVTGHLAARRDLYHFAGRSEGDTTFSLGLEARPVPQLLLRGQLASSFRAPDMAYIFTPTTKGYFSGSTDYWRCAQAGLALDKCQWANQSPGFNFERSGGAGLKSERGQSSGLGVVFQPSSYVDASLDFWKVGIKDLVTSLAPDRLLLQESDCRRGKADINSAECQDALARIVRQVDDNGQLGTVQLVRTSPINAAQRNTWGYDLSLGLRSPQTDFGKFSASGKYTKVRSYIFQMFPEDQAENVAGTLNHGDWPDRLQVNLGWSKGDWSLGLNGRRDGRISDATGDAWFGPYWTVGANASWQISKHASLNLSVANLLNKVRTDPNAGWPYYPVGYYMPYGRQAWVGFEYRLPQ
ncbi:TonB-dependent receptor domain-containing protein [Roseateles sp. BYS180W]|uniref:TonB-dependent receptor domain-containing protein n=1 Tax=Roseateles rivi TaxID=3299028 RepID=A0ABW7FU47_9BURK